MMRALIAALMILAAGVTPAFAERAVVRGLDKVTGHARDYALPIGRAVRIGSLEVTARSCWKAAPEDPPEVKIFVEVIDNPPGGESVEAERAEIFHGWLFASSPGLNALEHPVYDIWAIDCRA